jgi:hypothetical protein
MERLSVPLNVSEATLAKEGDSFLKIPGYSLPVFLALNAAFPKSMSLERFLESFERVNDLSPVLVAANEYADIGLSAERKIHQEGIRQEKFLPLHTLFTGLSKEFGERLSKLEKKYSGDGSIEGLEMVLDDFIFLSQERQSFSVSEIRLYQELDSGIIEAAYLVWTFPEMLKLVGFDPTEHVSTIDDLKSKYEVFDLSRLEVGDNDFVKKLQGIHAVTMCLKIDDDLEGSVDRILGIPNFTDWEKNGYGNLKLLRQWYVSIARRAGIPNLLTNIARLTSFLRGVVKDRKAKEGISPTDDYFNISDYAGGRKFDQGCNTLRQKLDASGLLVELFR